MVTVQIDDELAAVMRKVEESIEEFTRETIVLELHRRSVISSGKAAQLLGMARLDYIRFSGKHGIPYIDMTPEEFDAEMRTVDELTRS
jgi:hypothetical protein